jgi:hypothetical protein
VNVTLRPRDPGEVPSSDLPELTWVICRTRGSGAWWPISSAGSSRGSWPSSARPAAARPRCCATPPSSCVCAAEGSAARPRSCSTCVTALARAAIDRYGLAEPPGWLDGRLRAGDCVVLLDGLDEVARQEDRVAVSEWVSAQVRRYPRNDFVVTSRSAGYQSAPVDAAIPVQTQPLTQQQVYRFLHAWYLAVERYSPGVAGPDITRRAAAEALARLHDSPPLRELTVNPLLLTLIATVHWHHGALPGSRAELYAQICQACCGAVRPPRTSRSNRAETRRNASCGWWPVR